MAADSTNIWAQVIPAGSALIGGALAWLAQYLNNKQSFHLRARNEQALFKRQKSEEAYSLTYNLSIEHERFDRAVWNSINSGKDISHKDVKDMTKEWRKINLIIDLYIADASKEKESLLHFIREYQSCIARLIKENTPNDDLKNDLVTTDQKVKKSFNSLLAVIVSTNQE
jgi:hypothetical protein